MIKHLIASVALLAFCAFVVFMSIYGEKHPCGQIRYSDPDDPESLVDWLRR